MVVSQAKRRFGQHCIGAVALACLAFCASVNGTVALAQGKSEKPNGFVCMARSVADSDGQPLVTRVMVPRSYETLLTQRGFSQSKCKKARKWLQTTGPSMCGLADVQDPAFANQFMQRHGLTPAEICQLSQLLPARS